MSEPSCKHLKPSVEQGVTVLTIIETSLQDEQTADGLLQEFLSVVEHYRSRMVAIDLQNIRYISSVAFRPLLHLRRRLAESGGRLVLCGLSKVVGDVFYTTRLVSTSGSFDAPFELAADVPAAIELLSGSPPPVASA